MPTTFTCPHCEFETLIDERYAGQTGHCRNCGRAIAVPPFATLAAQRPAAVPPTRSYSAVGVVLAVLAVAGVGALSCVLLASISLTPLFEPFRRNTARSRCSSNLERIAQAMLEFEAENGTLPPPFVADDSGQPMHSWRVLLLPYLGEEALFRRYDLSQPWNSLQNLAVAQQMPSVYACPLDSAATSANETSYMVIVGPQTPFNSPTGSSRQNRSDDPSATILVVEVFDSAVLWTQPMDLDLSTLDANVNGSKSNSIRSRHEKGAHAAMADGKVVFLGSATSGDVIRAMATADQGEIVSLDDAVIP
jgi:hypothetical protein